MRNWLGALLVALLVLAEVAAVAHSYDAAAHANDQACAICVGAASFGAAAVGASPKIEPLVRAFVVAVATLVALVSTVPARRYARGPPSVSFTF